LKDFLEDWKKHVKNVYHINAMEFSENFLSRMESGTNVMQEINLGYKKTVEKNRRMVKVLFKVHISLIPSLNNFYFIRP
jgi:hypothetical protein